MNSNHSPSNQQKQMENKFITTGEMLKKYKLLESHFPPSSFKIYTPSPVVPVNGAYTDKQLSAEAVKMLEFVGLSGYSADVRYGDTEGNAGVIIGVEKKFEKAVHIKVSAQFKSSWQSLVAILAHEICHKLLPTKDLDTCDEILVDLCTIYVGFGKIVLNGYLSKSYGVELQQMGYLDSFNYKVANQLVNVVRGRMNLKDAGFEDTDPILTDLLKMWLSYQNDAELAKAQFQLEANQVSELLRNIDLLEQYLSDIKIQQAVECQRLSRLYGPYLQAKNGELAIHLVELIFQKFFKDLDKKPLVKPELETINNAINTLLFELHKTKNLDLHHKVICPKCGKQSMPVHQDKFFRCSNRECGIYFFHKGEPWNATVHQRKVNQQRMADAAERNELIEKRVKEETRKANQRVDDALADARKRIVYAQDKARKEVEDIRQNEINRYRETVKRRTPALLRWLLCKYL